jgi:uncharacterized membrane protein YoaK (UPF0700 family)
MNRVLTWPWAPLFLSFVAGFVDTSTFVGARGVFSAHVTGNFVLFAVAFTRGVREIDLLKLLLFVPFLFAVWLVARLSRNWSKQSWFEPSLLIFAGVLLALPAWYFFGVTELENTLWSFANIMIMLPVIAMGLQNALYKVISPTEPMTTVMTGNVITLVIEATRGSITEARVLNLVRLILGFAMGCLCGAWLVTLHSLGALFVPAFILLSLGLSRLRKVRV